MRGIAGLTHRLRARALTRIAQERQPHERDDELPLRGCEGALCAVGAEQRAELVQQVVDDYERALVSR